MNSIRARLLATLLTGLVVVLLGGGGTVYSIARGDLVHQFDASLDTMAHTIASLVKNEPGQRSDTGEIVARTVLEVGDAPEAKMATTYYMIWHAEAGRAVKTTDNLGDMILPLHEVEDGATLFADVDLPHDMSGRAVWFGFLPRVDEDDWDFDGEWEGLEEAKADRRLMVVGAALDRQPLDAAINRLLGTLFASGVAIGIMLALLLFFSIRWGLRPLDRLRAQLEGVRADTISQRFDDGGAPHELAPVYRELNDMLDRVEHTLDRERSFASAAAHELRTPLAELRATAEVAIRWPERERADAALRELLAIGGEMEHLVESLLLISRGHSMESDVREAAPLTSIVRGCLARAEDAIAAKHLNLTVDLNGGDVFTGPADAVEIILRNLIDNAIHYTPARGTIAIRDGSPHNGGHTLIIENGPIELGEADLTRLFEPFWQLEHARSDRTHVGLGLAIVNQVARAIGLRVDAELAGDRLQIQVSGAA